MRRGLSLKALLDEGAPVQSRQPFADRGYRVIHHNEVLAAGAKDDLVVAAALLNDAVLIAVDRDFRQMVRRFGTPQTENARRYERLNLIFLSCAPVLAPKRLEHAMSFVEHEWGVACERTARTMYLEIGPHHLRTYR